MLESLLPYYEEELSVLRKLSREFAEHYPRVAGQLLMDGEVCEDPHVERLLESFAFLTARLHKKLDDDFPQVSEALLSVLYPHYLRPIPSMSIAQLLPGRGVELKGMQRIEAHTQFLTRPVQGMPVKYRCAWPVEVWPLEIQRAACISAERGSFGQTANDGCVASLSLTLRVTSQTNLSQLAPRRLRFYLDGESAQSHCLYELLLNSVQRIFVRAADGEPAVEPLILPPDALQPVGFAADEGLLDYDPRSFLGYRLLQEYFVLPEKFLFVDLIGLDLRRFAKAIELRIELRPFGRPERLQRLVQNVNAENFRLHCTPVVNLFKQQAEPIRLSHEAHEYPVIPDVRRPYSLEVYSIDSLVRHTRSAHQESLTHYLPFYSVFHGSSAGGRDVDRDTWWIARRVPSSLGDDGSELRLALVDRQMNPSLPAAESLSLSLTCTNRDLPSQLPFGGDDNLLQREDGGAINNACLLKKPSATWRAPMRMANQWRLISHLALNHLSIVENGREALLEILDLYNFADSASLRRQLAGITAINSVPGLERIGQAPRRAWVRGTEVSITFDEEQYVGSGAYLLARVLEHFFGLYCSANSWIRLSVYSLQREELLARFPPRSGAQPLV
ncbi:type VI secretion system baseplate subunit TssF [Azotobacter chroococcum]|uniref:type VI secretion system baseplate subunit TssF n=1 Tax=Azotobacter chroococcum TaxID=353 RepID=UPI0010AE2A80|nr:type VI secretion system baseplate subunit TssF [Azotobacter chroococcum]TKD46933.1 type VI secretion system baseplate subunit TssF [Azotobacter chroococcum]